MMTSSGRCHTFNVFVVFKAGRCGFLGLCLQLRLQRLASNTFAVAEGSFLMLLLPLKACRDSHSGYY